MGNDITSHLDEFGFVISTEPSVESRGGNSAQHTAIYCIAENLQYKEIWALLDISGEPRLHWDLEFWPGHPGHMSRDNLTCCVCALKLNKMYPELRSLFMRIFMQAGFLWNNRTIGAKEKNKPWYTVDWCGFAMWGIFLYFKWSPLNYAFSAYLCTAARIQIYNTRKNPSHSDGHHNIIILLETSREYQTTLYLQNSVTIIARQVFRRQRLEIVLKTSTVRRYI